MSGATLPESGLGMDLRDALGRDFFQYFHLRVARQSLAPDVGGTVTFRPEAASLASRVALTADIDSSGRFRSLTLDVHRTVVDTAETEPLARDIIKSFLADATPHQDAPRVKPWMVDIMLRQKGDAMSIGRGDLPMDDVMDQIVAQIDAGKPVSVWMGGGGSAELPETPTEAFEVFAGEAESCEMQLDSCKVSLANVAEDDRVVLRTSIVAST
jgi:hypothetical protein